MKQTIQFLALLLAIYTLSLVACVHDPSFMDDDMGPDPPIDTMIVDTMVIDTMVTVVPCDSNVVYFSRDVLPLLKASCAQAGCHDQITQTEDIILDSYENIMASNVIKPFDLSDSDLYEVITEGDPDKRMPPPPANSLSFDQINLIAKWILQGAKNEMCGDTTQSGCVTANMSYAAHILPIMNTHCRSCHSGSFPAGGLDFTTHSVVQMVALNGKLVGAVDHQPGFSAMPQGGAKLELCKINQIKSWVAAGALNN
jgi:hypothetical protein